jgi:sialate O-acetylesterase
MNIRHPLASALLALGSLAGTLAWAEVSVAPIFGSDMVLQRGAPVPVFGTATPGSTVTVSFAGQVVADSAGADGAWQVTLTAMPASSGSSAMVVTESGIGSQASQTLARVQVGEVWLCSGQSNMGFPLRNANGGTEAAAAAVQHNLRLFRMTAGSGPATTNWRVADPASAGDFSAVCYWMGLELSQWLGSVPIGLVQATHDGTSIDHWQHSSNGIGDDYDAMVRSIQPYAVKGVLWYQGESNGGDAGYADKLSNMIAEWRSDWRQEALPFGIVQLAYRSGWNVARNAQLEVADSTEDCFLVVIRDLPGGSLHPPEKKPVGIRSAIGARGLVYGDNITWSGPIRDVEGSYVENGAVLLHWKHLGNGLVTDDGLAPGSFLVAGATGRFVPAEAENDGVTVRVWSPSVANPARVQYSYKSVGNLYNSVSVPTEGGGVTVDRLKASEFEITLAGNTGNQLPVAQFTYKVDGLAVNFDAATSSDADGTIAGYAWTFGDGATGSGAAPSHTYGETGTYRVVLTVTDNAGGVGQTQKDIGVSSGGGGGSTLHVASIIAYAQNVDRGVKRGVTEVVVVDDLGSPVTDAVVTVQFSGTFTDTANGTTDANGTARASTQETAKGSVSVSACVTGISHASLTYDGTTACSP